jgi:hypothetical protein
VAEANGVFTDRAIHHAPKDVFEDFDRRGASGSRFSGNGWEEAVEIEDSRRPWNGSSKSGVRHFERRISNASGVNRGKFGLLTFF